MKTAATLWADITANVTLTDNELTYAAVWPGCKHQIGARLKPATPYKDRPRVFFRGAVYDAEKMSAALLANDPGLLLRSDKPETGPTKRDMEMLRLRKAGRSFASIGRAFGVSGTRVVQVLDALSANHGEQKPNLDRFNLRALRGTGLTTLVRENIKGKLVALSQRAKERGVPFSLTAEDYLPLRKHCEVTGVRLAYGMSREGCELAATALIDPALGYVPGNIRIVSEKVLAEQQTADSDN